MRDLAPQSLPSTLGRSFRGLAVAFAFTAASLAQQNEIARLVPADAAPGDLSGFSVAISGDTGVVGAPYDDDGGLSSGSACVFVRSGSTWSQQAKLRAGDPNASNQFGDAVSISDDTIVVGASLALHGGQRTGAAYVFVRAGTAWTQQQKLTASDAVAFDHFGESVAVCGDTVLVGAWSDDRGGTESGSAYVFVRSGSSWTQQQKLRASDAAAGDWFGRSVSVEGDTALIGASRDDDGGADSGSAYVFVRSGTTWSQQQKLTAGDPAPGDSFGWSVSLSGRWMMIGAYRDDDRGNGSGSVYAFFRLISSFSERQKLTASDGTADDGFGWSVSLSGHTAVVGAPYAGILGTDSGSAYVFTLTRDDSALWYQDAVLPSDGASSDNFGSAVAVSDAGGAKALVGSPGRAGDTGATYVFDAARPTAWARLLPAAGPREFGTAVALSGNTAVVGTAGVLDEGAVDVFELIAGVWRLQQKLTASDGAVGDKFGFSVAIAGDTIVVGAQLDNDRGQFSGSAYVYVRGPNGWTQAHKLTASDGGAFDRFGSSVAVNEGAPTTIVVGAGGDVHSNGMGLGSAYVFVSDAVGYHLEQKLTASDASRGAGHGFGDTSVSISGNTAAIGACRDDVGANDSGSVYVFTRVRGLWSEQKLWASDASATAEFGYSVSIDVDTLIVGAPGSGAAYSFTRSSGLWQQGHKVSGSTSTAFGRSVAVSNDIVCCGAPFGPDGTSAWIFKQGNGGWQLVFGIFGEYPERFGWSVAVAGNRVLVGAPYADTCTQESGKAYVFLLSCRIASYGSGCGAALSAIKDPADPGSYDLQLTDSGGSIAVALVGFGDQRASIPFPPNCTIFNNLILVLPASIQNASLATRHFRPPAIPGLMLYAQAFIGRADGWLVMSNGLEFDCPGSW